MALFLAVMAPNPEITEQHCNIVACAGLKSSNMIVCMCFLSWERGGRCCHWQRYFSHKTLTSWFLPTPMNLWQITFDPKSRPAPSLAGRTKISGCLVQHIEIQARSQKHLTQSLKLSLQMFPSNQCWVLCIVTWFNWTQSLTIDIAGLVLTNIRPHLDNWFGSNCRTVYY